MDSEEEERGSPSRSRSDSSSPRPILKSQPRHLFKSLIIADDTSDSDSEANLQNINASQIERGGAGDKSLANVLTTSRFSSSKPGSLQNYLRNRHHVKDGVTEGITEPPQHRQKPEDSSNRSIEIFFGNLTNFGTFCNSLSGKPQGSDNNVVDDEGNGNTDKSPLMSHDGVQQHLQANNASDVPQKSLDSDDVVNLRKMSIFELSRPVSVPPIDDCLETFPCYHIKKYSKAARLQQYKNFAVKNNEELAEDVEKEIDSDKEYETTDDDEVEGLVNEEGEELMNCTKVVEDNNDILLKNVEPTKLDDDREEFEAIPNPLSSTVDPCAVKKLCLVGHPLTSFKGLNNFKKLHEAWITNCNISDLRWQDFRNLKLLQRLYLFGGEISTIEALHFENLRVLWLSNNKLTSLNFLTFGMLQLAELNVANNQITCLEAEDLYKCSCLQNLNVSGNPLCTVQDVENLNVVPTVKEFYLIDPSYGKCPVASICESRSFLVNRLRYVQMLNGKPVTDAERKELQLTISHKCLYYYADSVTCGSSYTARRKAVVQVAFKQLESLGDRIADLATFSAKCLQADYQMNGLPMFSKMQDQLMLDVSKIHTRLSHLKQWTRVVLRRIESLLRISRWEQQMDEWTKWLEFKSFGTIRAYISQSVTDLDSSKDEDDFRDTMHQLISALSCKKQWPRNTLLKLETIIVIQDRGAEAGMEKIFEDNYARKNEPKFIPPPPLEEDPVALATSLDIQHLLSGQPFYGPPSIQPIRVVPTYVDPNYKPPPPLFSYPESVPGLPERSQPLLLFLVTGSGACGTVKHNKDPLQYFHNLLFEKSRYFKEVRLTNCIWTATQLNYSQTNQAKSPKDASHSILFVVKVLEECLISVGKSNDCLMTSHNEDCMIFALRRPLCYSPAYIVYISHIPNDKKGNWYESVADDSDVTLGVSKMLEVISNRIVDLGAAQSRRNVPYYLHRTHDGVKADLTAVTKLLLLSTKHTDPLIKPTRNGAELLSVTKFLGPNILDTVTSLDLSANRLGLAVGLEGMISLKKLNLSYNNLTTLSGLHKLPQLKELKTGWNSLRFFHSNLNTLAWACSKLQVLEILPNPFQDVRDYGHIPVLANGYLPYLQRVDAWVAPFHPPSKCPISTSLELSCINANFSKEVLKFTWVGDNVTSMDYSGQCASNLDFLPPFPHQKETISSNRIGVLLNLSNNYITSSSLFTSSIVQNAEWRSFLVQLDLQENAVTNLGWMGNGLFPNLRIINMSNNQLSDLDALGFSCPNLEHLQISGNPIPCNFDVLQPLKYLKELMSLDASRTPIATHPEYSIYVRSNLTVQILDGVGLYLWNTMKAVGNKGGIMSHDWLETSLGPQNWNSLTELSLPHCDLHKVEFPSHSLPNLLSLDLTGNCLHTLAGLSVLLKLRVLCVSNNRIKSLGDPCPCCFEKMLEAQGGAIKNSASVESSKTSLPRSMSQKHHQSLIRGDGGNGTIATQLGGVMVRQDIQKTLFPNLEVLVLSHNAISSIENLHLHALPTLRTVILNCNKIKGFEGLDSLSTLKALVLDNNHITHIPFSSMKGCNSLKNLHLEHNRISVLPRLSNLHNLSALHIGYNRIQSLTDISRLGKLKLQELTLLGNPSCKSDYWKGVIAELPRLQKLDGVNILKLKMLQECSKCIKIETDEASDDWDDIDELPPGYIPDGGLKIKTLPIAYHNRLTNSE